MSNIERRKAVLAMEFLARCINDENVIEGWLMNGIADGDISANIWDPNIVEDYYIVDDTLKDLLSCFLRRMFAAYRSGGLVVDGIVSEIKEKYEI